MDDSFLYVDSFVYDSLVNSLGIKNNYAVFCVGKTRFSLNSPMSHAKMTQDTKMSHSFVDPDQSEMSF